MCYAEFNKMNYSGENLVGGVSIMLFQPKEILQQLRRDFEAEGNEIDDKLFGLLEEFINSANPKSLKESQDRVGQFLEYIEFRENADKQSDS